MEEEAYLLQGNHHSVFVGVLQNAGHAQELSCLLTEGFVSSAVDWTAVVRGLYEGESLLVSQNLIFNFFPFFFIAGLSQPSQRVFWVALHLQECQVFGEVFNGAALVEGEASGTADPLWAEFDGETLLTGRVAAVGQQSRCPVPRIVVGGACVTLHGEDEIQVL